MWNPNSNTHKAQHGGYKHKPTKQQVNAQMSMYAAIAKVTTTTPAKIQPGAQLKINFS